MARIEYAPDGKNWHSIKKGTVGKLWDYFIKNRDIRENLVLIPSGRFRLIGEKDKVIGVLAYDRHKKEFKHLTGVV